MLKWGDVLMSLVRAVSFLRRIGFFEESDPSRLPEVKEVEIIKFFSDFMDPTEDYHVLFENITRMATSFKR